MGEKIQARIELNNQGYKWVVSEGRREKFYKDVCANADYDGIRIAKVRDVMVYTGLGAQELSLYVEQNHLVTEVIGKNTYIFMTDYACDFIHRLELYVGRNGTDILFTDKPT